MFFPRSKPLSVAPVHVQGLRLSLNTPVVATEELPIGPARAAILVHDDPERGPTVTIGIRSLRADRVALYGLESGDPTDLEVAVDAALSFAESMGFLFDEDEVAGGGAQARSRGIGLWRDLLGDELGEPGVPVPVAAPEEPGELLLEDVAEEATEFVLPPAAPGGDPDPEIGDFVEPEREAPDARASEAPDTRGSEAPEEEPGGELSAVSDEERIAEAARAAARSAKRPPAVALTKFRGRPPKGTGRPEARSAPPRPVAAAKAGSESQKARATALGRMRLVRRVRDGLRKRNPILRLFGAF